jgi:uncharacterized protein
MRATEFRAPWWLPDGHTQTLWRRFGPSPAGRGVRRERQRLELRDGDFIDIDWAAPVLAPEPHRQGLPGLPIVLILHGLCGCSASPYVLSLQHLLSQHGYRSGAINFRSCSGEVNRLARAYHSGASDDLDEVFNAVQRAQPGSRFVVIGFSLGANVVLKWLGESSKPELLTGAVAVSTPFSLTLCSEAMKSGLSSLYGRYFLQRLVADMRRKEQAFMQQGREEELEKLRALGPVDRIATLWEFDDRVTAPLHGFADARDYYEQCSSAAYLPGIRTNTLIIQSSNDPIIPARAIPDRHALPDPVRLEVTPAGGHVGFAAAGQARWLEHRILRYIEGLEPFG